VKEPRTRQPTPWHQDMPYYNIVGAQNVRGHESNRAAPLRTSSARRSVRRREPRRASVLGRPPVGAATVRTRWRAPRRETTP
jgi:hypothetical protein